MLDQHIERIAAELSLDRRSVRAVSELLDGGATLPFIARYRKEATGDLDELAIGRIREALNRFRLMDERRAAIIRSLLRQGQMSAEIEERLNGAASLAELEDIYLPFRPRRRTRSTVARMREENEIQKRRRPSISIPQREYHRPGRPSRGQWTSSPNGSARTLGPGQS